jgi:8-oxo-dGTP pyrophosphatase MutT (NUDIX family)
VPNIDDIRRCLGGYSPMVLHDQGSQKAAVAIILRERRSRSLEVLFIKRALQAGDPWSGQMAFPGGRVEPVDASIRSAAERETLEEVGLALGDAEKLGRLDDLEGLRGAGRPAGIVISAFVYHHESPGPLRANAEVEEALWVPLSFLTDPTRRVEYSYPLAGAQPYPGILVGDPDRHVVWGLTYRFVEMFLAVTGRALPDRWGALRRA